MKSPSPARAKGLVLLVEDDPALLLMTCYNLAQRGYRVATAADGEAALLALAPSRPDAVALVWMLPGPP